MEMKVYPTFLKSPKLEPRYQFNFISGTLVTREGSYHTAEMQSVYSTVSADWTDVLKRIRAVVNVWQLGIILNFLVIEFYIFALNAL